MAPTNWIASFQVAGNLPEEAKRTTRDATSLVWGLRATSLGRQHAAMPRDKRHSAWLRAFMHEEQRVEQQQPGGFVLMPALINGDAALAIHHELKNDPTFDSRFVRDLETALREPRTMAFRELFWCRAVVNNLADPQMEEGGMPKHLVFDARKWEVEDTVQLIEQAIPLASPGMRLEVKVGSEKDLEKCRAAVREETEHAAVTVRVLDVKTSVAASLLSK